MVLTSRGVVTHYIKKSFIDQEIIVDKAENASNELSFFPTISKDLYIGGVKSVARAYVDAYGGRTR